VKSRADLVKCAIKSGKGCWMGRISEAAGAEPEKIGALRFIFGARGSSGKVVSLAAGG